MAVERELYELLGVAPDASEGEVRKAYMKMAKLHHPDKNINDPEAHAKFQEISAAYEILNDPQTREVYDREGMEGLTGGRGRGPGGMGMEDFFSSFFSFDPAGPGFGGKRGKPSETIQHPVTLADLYNGKLVKVDLEKQASCTHCHGAGTKSGAKAKPCATCDGKGFNIQMSQLAPGRLGTSRVPCHACSGKGQIIREKDRCKKCKGEQTITQKNRHEIFIEKGMSNGQRIVLAGAGDEEPGFPADDVIFVLQLEQHPSFERAGKDLLTHVNITLSEALFGFSRILVTHLDGRGLEVTSPAGKIIKPGDSIVLRGEGMPTYKRPEEKGDLYVILDIEMPSEQWLKNVDRKTVEALLPPKRPNPEPMPDIVDRADYEESDIVDVGSRSFPAGSNFFDHFSPQFGDDEDEWEDEDDDDDDPHAQPECHTQ